MRKLRKFLAAASLLFVSLLISTPSGYSQTSYTWSSVGSMVQARSGAAAVSLPGGKVLITGGADSDGVPATASEIFDPGSGGFATAAPMNVPRANHSAILLATGDVLVTGGVTTGGGYSDTAEIFSAQAGVWTVLEASLGTGLAKHAMATLSDGNVLIAGGQSTAGPVGSLLLFNVSDRSFTSIGNLMVARTGAVAAATPDGRVLIAGGTDINGAVLSSTEVFTYAADTMTGTVTAGPTMTYPRTNATATTTYDGVAVIGGNSGNADLGSAEIFSQWTNAFRLVGGATPRSGHIAIFLPQNGSILAMGGSGGTTVDLLQPWGNNIAGAFLTSMPSSLDHTGGFVAPATIGTMLAGGGTGSSADAAEVYWFPTISTDQPDYAPGTPVVMNGMGFKPGENVKLYMREWVNQMLVDPPDYTVTTDANGSFRFMEYAPTISDLGARYHLTVTGATSGLQAQVVFTDNYPKTNLTIAVNPAGGSPTANSVVAGSTSGASDYIFTCTTAGGCTNTATNINNNANAFITATAGTGRLFSSWSVSGDTGGTGTTCVTGYTGNPCILNAGTSSRTTKVTANFSLTTSLTPTLVAADKVYDGTAAEPNDSMSCTLSAVHTGDNVTCTATSGSFATANAGPGNTVTATVTLGGPDAAKYTFGAAGTVVSSEPATVSATIKQATATISVTPYSVTYDGAAHTATGTATGIGSANLTVGLSLGGTTHTNAGTYSDTWTFQDAAGNYANATGNVTDVIKQAKAAISVTPYTTTYDGISHTATGTATGINSVVISGLVLTGTTHTNAGTYSADGWSFHDGSGNYADDSGTVNDVIDKASATVSVTPYTVTYSGTSHTATASISGVHGETDAAVGTVDLSHTSHMNASVYAADYWTFTGASNYKDIGNTIITDTINKADATVTITPYTVTYDGQAHTAAIASITGVAGETGATVGSVDVSHTTHTNAGAYSVDFWTFTGTANYNDIATKTITDTINKADATVTVTPYTVTYDGQAHTAAIASVTGVAGETGATVGSVDVSHTSHTNAGAYSADFWSFTGSANYNDIATKTITDTINKATATIVVTPYSVTYDGQAHTAATTSITGVAGETGATVGSVDVSHTSHINAGAYASDYWTFAPTANYNDIAAKTITDTIDKATATIVVAPYSVTYDGNPHTAMVTSITGVNGEAGATVGSVDATNTTHINAGTYLTDTWSFTGGANYKDIAATTITDVINKADATLNITPYDNTYDGNPHTATATATGVKGEDLSSLLTLAGTTHTSAGDYPNDAWSFAGNNNYNTGSATVHDHISKAEATISVTPYTVTYDGNPHSATATATGVKNEDLSSLLTLTGTTHIDAGDYTADTWSFSGNNNYNAGSSTVHDHINKADANISVTAYGVIYDGNAHTATATATGVKNEDLSSLLSLAGTIHTNAGDYPNDAWSFAGSGNYNEATGAVHDQISKANASISVTPYTVTYDGNTHTATAAAKGVKDEDLSSLLTVSGTMHMDAGDYTTDCWSFSGNNNYNAGSGTVHDHISKADANISVTPFSVTYDGNAHTATVSATGVKNEDLSSLVTLTGTTHVDAGDYVSDSWTFAGNINYNPGSGTTHDHISKADATIAVTPYSVTYDGSPHQATATAKGVKGEDLSGLLTLSNTLHTNAGDYPNDPWSFAGTGNYNSTSGSEHDQISKANAIVDVKPYSVTYDGDPHAASGTAVGVKGESLGGLDLAATTHITASSYNDGWNFTDSTGNYNNASGTVNDVITRANTTVDVAAYSVTYDGNAHTATGTVAGVKGESLSGLDLSGTTHTDANHYTDSWTFTDATGNYNNATGKLDDVISKATATVGVTPYSLTFDGNAHTATATATGVKGEDLSGLLTLSGTTHTSAGDYTADAWSFAGTGNYSSASGTVHDQISKADAVITVTGYRVTYDENEHTATGTATGIKGESLSGLDLSGTTHTNANTYSDSWTFVDATGNYKNASGTTTDDIAKAAVTVTVTPYSVKYDGNSHIATGSAQGKKGESLSGLDLGGTTHTSAGSYDDNWTFTDSTGNYINTTGSVNNVISKADALLKVTAYNLIYDGKPHIATGSATGVKGEVLSGLDLTGTSHTTAGTYSADSWKFTDSTGNYNDAIGTVLDVIGQVPLSITANDKSMVLNAALPAFTASYSGFVNGEGSTALEGTLSCSTSATGKTIGTFPIKCAGQTAQNYNISYNPGTLTVSYLSGGACNGDVGHQILQPINANGTSVFSSKSTSPAKFRVCDTNGVSIGTPGVVAKFLLYQVLNGTATSTVNEAVDSTTPDAAFRWDPTAQQWIFNIDNKSLQGANRTFFFVITLNDGSTIPFSYGLK